MAGSPMLIFYSSADGRGQYKLTVVNNGTLTYLETSMQAPRSALATQRKLYPSTEAVILLLSTLALTTTVSPAVRRNRRTTAP
jgi:hypothetical protein